MIWDESPKSNKSHPNRTGHDSTCPRIKIKQDQKNRVSFYRIWLPWRNRGWLSDWPTVTKDEDSADNNLQGEGISNNILNSTRVKIRVGEIIMSNVVFLPPQPMQRPLAMFSCSKKSYRGEKYLMNEEAVISGVPVISFIASCQGLENPSAITSLV